MRRAVTIRIRTETRSFEAGGGYTSAVWTTFFPPRTVEVVALVTAADEYDRSGDAALERADYPVLANLWENEYDAAFDAL